MFACFNKLAKAHSRCSLGVRSGASIVGKMHRYSYVATVAMGFAVRVRSTGQKYGPTCHQRDRADVTEFVTLVRLSSLGQHVGVLTLAGYKRRKSALTAGPIVMHCIRTDMFRYC